MNVVQEENPLSLGHNYWPTFFSVVAIVGYGIFFASASIIQHNHFGTGAYDLGVADQLVWNTLHGQWLWQTNVPEPHFRLAVHFEPILIPLSLIYLLWPDVRALLLIQSVALALGAIPIYWLGRDRLGGWPALIFVIAYLLFPALQAANMFEFHPVTLAVPLLAFAFYYLNYRRYSLFLLCAGLALLCREDVSLIVAMMGFYHLVTQRARMGGVIFIGGIIAFSLIYLVIISHFSTEQGSEAAPYISHFATFGASPLQVAMTLITRPNIVLTYIFSNPDKVRYLTHLTAPVAFLAIGGLPALLPALPIVVINLLAQAPPIYALDRFHYSVTVVPFVIFAAILGVERVTRWLNHWRSISPRFTRSVLAGALLISSLGYHLRFGHTPLALGFSLWPYEARHATAAEMFQMIPPGAVVSAQSNLNPHLSQRRAIYLFPKLNDPTVNIPAEYVALDQRGNIFPLSPEEYKMRWQKLVIEGEYQIIFDKDGYLLLRRRAADGTSGKSEALPPISYRLGVYRVMAVRSQPQAIPERRLPRELRFGHALDIAQLNLFTYRDNSFGQLAHCTTFPAGR